MKILKIEGEPTVDVSTQLRERRIYPSGTKRVVSKYFVLSKTINTETRRGRQTIEQIAEVTSMAGCDADIGPAFYNKWEDVRFVDQYPVM